MIKKYYLNDLRIDYNVDIDRINFNKKIEKYFIIKKDEKLHKKCYIEAEETYVNNVMLKIKQEIEFSKLKNPIEKYKYAVDKMFWKYKKDFNFTINTFTEFTIKHLNQSKKEKNESGVACTVLEFILTSLTKDICYVDNAEITKLLSRKAAYGKQCYLVNYLKFLKQNYESSITFTIDTKIKTIRRVKDKNDFYTDEQWFQYKKYLCNIDLHIINAFNNKMYAKYWLYFLLHFSLAWRKNDILNFPRLENLDVDRYTLDWFYNNDFTFDDAFYIISNSKLVAEQYYTQKTESKLHFNIPVSLMIPTAIALIICEQWARKNEFNSLFGTKNIRTKYINKFFEDNMNGFSSLKANRTLLSLANKTASELEISQAVTVASYMRSHKISYSNTSDTTKVYLKSTYDESELHSITTNLFEKGAFGWLFDYAISCFSEKEKINLKSYEIEVLEDTSDYLLNQNTNKVLNELMSYTKDELVKILNGERASKQENVYCIKNYCDKNLQNECLECPYSIPTIYSMYSVANEINSILEKLCKDDNKSKRDKDRYMYRLLKLLNIARVFKETFGINNSILFLDYDNALLKTKNLLEGGI